MMDLLSKIDLEKVVQWLYWLVLLVGVIKAIRAKGNMDKWTLIRESVPMIHNVVQKASELTPTKKDDAFVALMRKLLETAGFNLDISEEKAVAALGEGYHQEFKMDRAMLESAPNPEKAPASAEGN